MLSIPHVDAVLIAKQLRQLLKVAQLPPPFVLVGWSFGGMIAEQFACMYPTAVQGMVLIDPSPPASSRLEPSFPELLQLGIDSFRVLSWLNAVSIIPLTTMMGAYPAEAGFPDAPEDIAEGLRFQMAKTLHHIQSPHFAQAAQQELLGWYNSEYHLDQCRADNNVAHIGKVVISAANTLPEIQREQLGPQAIFTQHILAQSGDHYIPYRNPQLIYEGIQTLFNWIYHHK